jgi:elongation factor Ts
MAFTAADVKNLREKTGVGMMDCKKALTEAEGDFDRAIDILRERGLAAATKKAGRITAEGVVLAYQEGGVSVLVEVNSETDFVGKNAEFQGFVLDVAKTIAAENPSDVEALMLMQLHGSERTVEEMRQERVLSLGENLNVRRFARVAGNPAVASYIHGGGSMGVLAVFGTDAATAESAAFKAMGKDVAMQIAAMSPQYLGAAAVPAEVIEHEKQILKAQLAEDPKMAGKPEKVLEGIIQGRIGKFYKEVCLMEQQFVKDGEISVGQYIKNVAKELGAPIEAVDFVRFVKGENLQKREDDFAAEVAAAAQA